MGFWTLVLGIFVGMFIYNFIDALLAEVIRYFRNRGDKRKIGFGSDTGENRKNRKETQMRRIGFGEND